MSSSGAYSSRATHYSMHSVSRRLRGAADREPVLGRALARPAAEEAQGARAPAVEDLVERRDRDEREERRRDDAADDRDAHRRPELRPLAAPERHREHPGD